MVKCLCVAEKPSIARGITEILSGGRSRTRNGGSRFVNNYEFSYRLEGYPGFTDFVVTAVVGHLTANDFDDAHRGWRSCDAFDLFDAPIITFIPPKLKDVARNLQNEARTAQILMIWTDCDREGEHIGWEVQNVCLKVNPRLVVLRARFSAIIANQIHQACQHAVALDERQASAVEARIMLDLRVGAALTRLQTFNFQAAFPELQGSVISYGPCQFPALGFVVEQYERMRNFVAEAFWSIQSTLRRDGATVTFNWARNRLFDREVAGMLHQWCLDDPEATITSVQTKPASKWKPLPLTTVELQKSGSRILRLSPKKVLEIADALYQRGILSYPRTETDQFDPHFNFQELIEKQTQDTRWGPFAQRLHRGEFERPRGGRKNDHAHPPIHPTAHANLQGDEARVYELVTRRFLACCHKNATGRQTTVRVSIAREEFNASGLIVLERNYLDVYPYDRWEGNALPDFHLNETFLPATCELKEGKTTGPSLLTEADLVNLMDKNGIGTDATIAEHIEHLLERDYISREKDGRSTVLVPTTLGIGLVEGYNRLGLDNSLSKPHLRRMTEHRMSLICTGQRTQQDVIEETLDEYREMFIVARRQWQTLTDTVREFSELGAQDLPPDDGAPVPMADVDGDEDDDAGPPPARRATRGRGTRARGAARATSRARGRGMGRGQAYARSPSSAVDDHFDSDDDHRSAPIAAHQEAAAEVPRCQCEQTAVLRTVNKATANKGRTFYSCSKPQDSSCGFFEWADTATPSVKRERTYSRASPTKRARPKTSHQNGDASVAPRCQCDLTATRITVKKDGPNQGREFWKCSKVSAASQCKFFEWIEQSGNAAMTSGSTPSTYSCYVCGEPHMAKDCPQRDNPDRRARGRGRGRGRGKRGR
ncbi:uncharacterized protein L969DRAFT_89097 [Mixia osmundae IAM 14324]|uniref:DNA topoisomerase n=1 Tax=Mixia osmundae (strain CBS 9802 / IAM 14324 / JCM 22182 / KY 12970) TaxID=764103 RepID=G7E0M5_MIXOS|nr:uncharacterized protein L969DRAFT_89097 [Mixia osmundae IAM 14324]KEI37859.1 hypothetical protein L969DRAFT_89097 [Mixia osmundae IAM 14324]GAA96385.1 hypothetical protein E5Q_03052 [Mixia osmundae IAM 14324]